MLRIASRTVAAVKPAAPAVRVAARNFSLKLNIPVDREQQGGRRKEEIDAEDKGEVGFNRDPIVPSADAGTKENPILVSRSVCLLVSGLRLIRFCRCNSAGPFWFPQTHCWLRRSFHTSNCLVQP